MKKYYITFVIILSVFLTNKIDAQTYNMINGIIDVSHGTFYDDGGASNPYNSLAAESIQMTLNSITNDNLGNLNPLQFNFSEFSCGIGDTLYIYDGNSTSSPLIGAYTLIQSPGVFNTTGSAITFVFVSDGIEDAYGLNNGWVAQFSPYNPNPSTILLSSGTITQTPEIFTCNATLYDSGGPSGNYSLGGNNTLVITSSLNSHLIAYTQFFDVHTTCLLEIFDGNLNTNPNARRIGYFKNGFTPPAQIISSTQSLTFKFTSNGSPANTAGGFQFNIGCIPAIFQQPTGASGFPGTGMGMYEVGSNTTPTNEITFDCNQPIVLLETTVNVPGVSTYDYTVSSIPFAPPFPWYGTGLIQVPTTQDDMWLGPKPLTPSGSLDTFSFSFYGSPYTFCVPNSNGAISFNNITIGPAGYVFNQTIPNILDPNFTFINGNNHKNTIFGVFQDTYPGAGSPPQYSGIYYGHQGTYPNRVFVFTFYRLPQYSCTSDNLSTYQMVLYEGTNIIDVYIQDRTVCESWNSGSGLVGILNIGGNQAVTPPNRNTGNWVASQEAWRFTPITPVNYEIQWFENVVNNANKLTTPITNDSKIAVRPNQTTNYISLVTATRQDGSTYSFLDTLKVIVNTPTLEGNIVGNYFVSLNQIYSYSIPNATNYDSLIWSIDNPNWTLTNINGTGVNVSINSLGNGTLSVYGINQCGVSDTIQMNISTTLNIDDQTLDFITVSPNPTSGLVKINSNITSNIDKIDVLDNKGRVLLVHTDQLPTEIDITSQSSGTYYIRMWVQNKVIGTTKIIKK
ncbi:MAG: hypothetical protein CVU04_00355 [Bacteroidetes bacterium HGW-Bacteroidetes-20]|nr:MAG: hypothetical protein CVU04_00355 [Bacteroidetes bacterium HGW-Bacteroidetes-20]